MKLLNRKKKKIQSTVIRGKIHEVNEQYSSLLEKDIKVIATSLCKDYTSYGYTETFVLMVTYQKLK